MSGRMKGRVIPSLLLAVFFAAGLFAAGCDMGNDVWDEPVEPPEETEQIEELPEW